MIKYKYSKRLNLKQIFAYERDKVRYDKSQLTRPYQKPKHK